MNQSVIATTGTSPQAQFPGSASNSPQHNTDQAPSLASSVDAIAKARGFDELERIRRSVLAVGEVAYHWDIASDKLVWSSNVTDVIQVANLAQIGAGRSYADLLDSDNFTSRYDTVMRSAFKDQGAGVPFAIEYLIHPQNEHAKRSVWLEDCGRWYAGKDDQPAEVFGIVRHIDDRHERDEQLAFIGNCDPLTGMMNRGRLAQALSETIARAESENSGCAFLIAVINNLAVVNDAYGFDIADEVIISVGHRLRRVVRAGDMIGRYAGAKFGIILADCSEEEIKIAAERFLSVARDSVIDTERGPVWAMLSIGCIVLPKFASDANTAMAYAEEALAEAKRQPSDPFVAYQHSAERVSERSLNARCAAEIVSGLNEERFTLAFQPIVDAKTGEATMQEALLRMRCDDGQSVAAHHLIPISEKLGLIRLIDRAVARLVVDTLIAHPELSISLNVSGTTATDPRWFDQLTSILSESAGVTERIVVEITETVALHDLEQTIRFTRALRELGCRVAIDDFGAGFTSFKNLKELHVDMVKIDGSFCDKLAENKDNQYFVRSLIDLAKKFELLTVAEWVQSEEDAELLRSWGIDYMQGNLFGEAVTEVPWALPASRHQERELEDGVAFDASLISIALQEPDDPAASTTPADPPDASPTPADPPDASPTPADPPDASPIDPVVAENAAVPNAIAQAVQEIRSFDPSLDASDPEPIAPPSNGGGADSPMDGPQPQTMQPATNVLVADDRAPDQQPANLLPSDGDAELAPDEVFTARTGVAVENDAEAPADSVNDSGGFVWQPADHDQTTVLAAGDASGSGQDAQAIDGTSHAAGFEPVKIDLNLSKLKSAMSELDATFGQKAAVENNDPRDVATAIAETFGPEPAVAS